MASQLRKAMEASFAAPENEVLAETDLCRWWYGLEDGAKPTASQKRTIRRVARAVAARAKWIEGHDRGIGFYWERPGAMRPQVALTGFRNELAGLLARVDAALGRMVWL